MKLLEKNITPIVLSNKFKVLDEAEKMFVKINSNSTSDITFVFWGEKDIISVFLYDLNGKLLSTNPITNKINKYEIHGMLVGEYTVQLNLLNGETLLRKVIFL